MKGSCLPFVTCKWPWLIECLGNTSPKQQMSYHSVASLMRHDKALQVFKFCPCWTWCSCGYAKIQMECTEFGGLYLKPKSWRQQQGKGVPSAQAASISMWLIITLPTIKSHVGKVASLRLSCGQRGSVMQACIILLWINLLYVKKKKKNNSHWNNINNVKENIRILMLILIIVTLIFVCKQN